MPKFALNNTMKKYLITLIIPILIYSCKKEEGCMDPTAANYNSEATLDNGECTYPPIKNFNIHFTQTINGNPLDINEMIYTNHSNEIYSVQTLRYLISNINLQAEDGTITLLDEVHFIDISIDSTLTLTLPEIANKNYISLSFTMGLDSTKNITNLFLNENFFPSFAWPDLLGGGYHYMQLEGDFNTVFNGYATHTGATNGIDFSFNNIFPVTINRTNNIRDITINMEITNWYQNPTLLDFTTNGIMGDIISQEILQANGIEDVFSIN